GTFTFMTDKKSLLGSGIIFRIESAGFIYIFSIQNVSLVVQRNDVVSVLTLNDVPEDIPLGIYVMWNFSELTLTCRFGSLEKDEKKSVVPTPPLAPPINLIRWARKNNLLPVEEYISAEEFRNKVHSCLLSIQDKLQEIGAYSQFWNITYNGKKIEKRIPKHETEVQPIIQCLLSDQFLMASIEIIPEFKGGVGDLDFLFIAKIKDQGFAYFCVEFKNAHSDKLVNGLTTQLPSYIQNKGASYGAYCVLDYRGQWFDKPILENNDSLSFYLNLKSAVIPLPMNDNIRVFVYELSKPLSASKR
ncbi:unnamed protein product, partial [marine sediment metagenome]